MKKTMMMVLMLTVMLLFSVGIVSALAVQIDVKNITASQTISGIHLINVSLGDHNVNITNVSFYVTDADGNEYKVGMNHSVNHSNDLVNATWDEYILKLNTQSVGFSTTLYDTNTYTLNVSAYNTTQNASDRKEHVASTTITGIKVDNTNPVCTVSTPSADNVQTSFPLNINVTATNATSCTITINNKQYTSTTSPAATLTGTTEGGETCSVHLTNDKIGAGSYTVGATTTDVGGTDTSTCTTRRGFTFSNDMPAIRGAVINQELRSEQTEAEKAAGAGSNGRTVVIAGLIGAAAWFGFLSKKALFKIF